MEHLSFSKSAAVVKNFARLQGIIFLSVAGLFLTQFARAESVYENYTFTTFAGPSEAGLGSRDGVTNAARFGSPAGMAKDSLGNVYIADPQNNTIRKISVDGTVSTVAGETGVAGNADGAGFGARFNSPNGIAVDSNGNLFVADTGNDTIRKISPSGMVTTFAGLAGQPGKANGNGSAARFNNPYGVMVDPNNNVYVADTFNDTIRKITPDGTVTTVFGKAGVAGSANKKKTSATFDLPTALAMDSAGNIYVVDTGSDLIRKVSTKGAVTTLAGTAFSPGSADGTGGAAQFHNPFGIAVDSEGNIYVADTGNHTIRKITSAGVVTTFAGKAGTAGSVDGVGTDARFNSPTGIAAGNSTDLVVGDFGNGVIRQVSADATVGTLAGAADPSGSADGTLETARFNFPSDVALDNQSNLYVADFANHTIRKIDPAGDVITLAGTAGVSGTNDGTGQDARFNNPTSLAVDGNGNIYVADTLNNAIRKVTPDGVVSTLAGKPGSSGTNDGSALEARFNSPFCLTVDNNGNIFVSDTGNNTIRKISSDGQVSTLAGVGGTSGTNDGAASDARFSAPEGIAVDSSGNLFVVDALNSTIRKISPAGMVTTFAGAPGITGSADGVGSVARFNVPFGLAVDASDNLYVADKVNETIRKITPAGSVTTLGGSPNVAGADDGTGQDARFRSPEGLVVDSQGNLYLADATSHSIRKGYPAPPDVPVVDLAGGPVNVARHFSISNMTTTSWSWSLVRRPAASSAELSGTNTANLSFTPDVEDVYIVRFQGWDNSGRTVIRTLTLYADDTPPSVTVTNPVAGQISSNGVFTVSGTASDNLALSNVWVQLNGGAWTAATGTANWSLDLALTKGTNAIRVYAEDVAANVSSTNEVDLLYIPSATLTVQINGGGTVTPDLNGALLEIGRTYSITAQPGANCAFVSWTGSLPTNSPTLTFVMASNLTFTANFTDPVAPTVAITFPKNGGNVSNAVFTATGTAADNGQLASVWYQLNGGAWAQATNTANWSAGLAPVPGANTLQVYAMDTFGNISTTNSANFTYIPSSTITVITTGQGTISPNYNGALLQIGNSFTMTAKPAIGYLFSDWQDANGNVLTTDQALAFVVQTDTTFQANFIRNPFSANIGPFAGLFYDTNNIGLTNSGFISFTLASFGSFSAKLSMASGNTVSVNGQLSTQGTFSNSVPVKNSTPIIVQLQFDSVNIRISGSVSGAGWVSPLFAVRADYSTLHPAPEANNKYTLVIPGGDDSSVQPGGNGFCTLSVNTPGDVTLQGVLGDGAKAAQKTFISKTGQWPLYLSPYKGQGVLFGWMTFTNEPATDLNGTVYWLRLPQAAGNLYPNGFAFPNGIQAIGSLYSFTNGVPLLNLPSGGSMILQQGGLAQSFTNAFTLGSNNQIVGVNVKITTKSGVFQGTAVDPNSGASIPVSGVLLQKQNGGYGFFLGNAQSGAVYLGQ